MKEKLSILIVDENKTACSKLRTIIPYEALRERGHEINIIDGNDNLVSVDQIDIIVFNRVVNGNILQVVNDCKYLGKKVIYDTDDALDLIPPTNLGYNRFRKSLNGFQYLLKNADVITTTGKALAYHLMEKTEKPVVVLPNYVRPSEYVDRPRTSKRVRVGFAGSNTHLEDIILPLKAIAEIRKEGNYDFDFVLFGFSSSHDTYEAWVEDNLKALSALPKGALAVAMRAFKEAADAAGPIEWVKGVPMAEYYQKLADLDLDLGICPLLDTEFNKCKSALKYYDYALTGTAVIASEVIPYGLEMKLNDLVENTVEDWKRALLVTIDSRIDREARAKWQKEWVTEHMDIAKHVEDREKFLLALVNDDPSWLTWRCVDPGVTESALV